ncbi:MULTISPECIES: GOLPH3/VPS74 family protein [unclassified Streptomyces]|uniref:GOLPH3/VPS74 family protein n=1 Tax=unclassified Streptomyces TaxID=2593676 RepID=UPI002E28BE26|nr:GPP34 family phosphoprotein [Streptomyces sp. NBC_01439]
MTLGLPGRYLLLAAGALAGDAPGRREELSLGVAGAALMSLTLAGRLGRERGALVVVNDRPTGAPHLDQILQRLRATRRPKSVSTWVNDLAPVTYEGVLSALVSSGELVPVPRGWPSLPAGERYGPADRAQYERYVGTVRNALFRYPPVSRNGALTASLLCATGVHQVLFQEIGRKRLGEWSVLEESLSAVCDPAERAAVTAICLGVRDVISGRTAELQFHG